MASDLILQTDQLTKRFGRILAVDHLNLSVHAGQVFGILGPNGSGKTTTLGMVLGVISKTEGSYSWFGQGENHNLRKQIGAILEQPAFYPFLSARRNLEVTAHIKEVDKPKYDELLDLVNLSDRQYDKFKTYSLGMKQRLAIAAALLADPEVLIFDEPTNGLDPQGIAEIRNLIRTISATGKTIILASHLLDEVQKVCSHFAVLKKGKMIFTGSVDEVVRQKNQLEIAAKDNELLQRVVGEHFPIEKLVSENGLLLITGREEIDKANLNRTLMEKGIILTHLVERRSNLEEKFLNILAEDDS